MEEAISIDFPCVNCDKVFVVSGQASLYCSQHCQQNARLVRYMRACMRDGRIKDPLVREAIQIQLAFACSEQGYYDKKARQIPLIVRRKVIERDKGLCRKCGDAGIDIDHINGDSWDMDNLQLLCRACHNEKTNSNMVVIRPEHEHYEEFQDRKNELRRRVDAPTPLRLCDDERQWNTIYSQIMAEQRKVLRQIKEDIEGTARNRDPIEEEWITQELHDLSELRSEIEALEIEKQTRINEIGS
jgi:5-methylcytosine-specific restriction endonuclease McrA